MKTFFRSALLSLALLTSCSTLTQMASLMTCDYTLAGLSDPKIAGISLTNTGDIANLDAMSLLRLTTSLLSGSVPLSTTVNLGVSNPNQTAAQVAGLDWMLYFNNSNVLSGATQQQVYVAPNGGRSVIPFAVQMDLGQLFGKNSKDDLISFANGLLHMGESGSTVSLRIRPAVSFGGQTFKTNYITVSKSL